jgi:hypothetical protein
MHLELSSPDYGSGIKSQIRIGCNGTSIIIVTRTFFPNLTPKLVRISAAEMMLRSWYLKLITNFFGIKLISF